MGNTINRPRGTQDFIGADATAYDRLVKTLDDVAKTYGVTPIMIPTFEEGKLFKRGVGESTDIVSKETFDLVSKGGHDYILRPEFTAGITRATIENKLYASPDLPLRLCYSGSVFRYERPQAGRLRELHQWGVEFVDSKLDLATTADALVLMVDAARTIGIKARLRINYLGSSASRERYRAALVDYFTPQIGSMCEDCRRRLEQNPLRILDCKVEGDRLLIEKAPHITDFLTDEDQKQYDLITETLELCQIDYEKDDRLVRGLDYYTGIVFELYEDAHLQLGALGGGGRYDGLMSALGGPEFQGVGFSFGLDRLLMALGSTSEAKPLDLVLLASADDAGFEVKLKHQLRQRGYRVVTPSFGKSLSGALKSADRLNARYLLFFDAGVYQLKDLTARTQLSLGGDDIFGDIVRELERGRVC